MPHTMTAGPAIKAGGKKEGEGDIWSYGICLPRSLLDVPFFEAAQYLPVDGRGE